jgi:hypothetical protein
MPGNLGIGGALEMNFDDYNQLTFTMDINKLLVPTPISRMIRSIMMLTTTIILISERSLYLKGVLDPFDAPGWIQ